MGLNRDLGNIPEIVKIYGSNVGINTSSDNGYKLEIGGTLKASGDITGNSFVKIGGTSSQLLTADGSVLTAGTGISISGGTISSTVTGGVTSFNTRTGAITLSSTDVTTALGYTPYNSTNPNGYISSYTETDPTVPSHVKSITTTEKSNWNTAFGWGNHASAGYVPSARTITINGTSYDLSANRSWTVTAAAANYLPSLDTRSTASTPQTADSSQGIRFDFKSNSTNGLSDGGTYNGTMYFRPYGSTTDFSGGPAYEMGFTGNGNIWHRTGSGTSWGSWYKLLDSNNYSSYSWPLEGGWKPSSLASSTRLRGATSPDGGEFALAYSSGQIHPYADGFFYQDEGRYRVIDSNSISSQSVNYATTASAASGVSFLTQPNPTWGARVQLGGNGGGSGVAGIAVVQATDGNLHLDSGVSKGIYLNYYQNGPIYLNGTTYSISSNGAYYNGTASSANNVGGYSVSTAGSANTIPTRNASGYLAPANWIEFNGYYGIYSPNNGAHFFPNNETYGSWKVLGSRNGWRGLHFGESTGMTLMMNEDEFGFHRQGYGWTARFTSGTGHFNIGGVAARATRANGNLYIDDDHGNTVVGVYSAYRFQGVYAMGDSYKLPVGGGSCGNHYGIAWSHPYAGGEAAHLTDHGMLIQVAGQTRVAISTDIWCIASITAYSDARVKDNIKVIDNPLERIKKVRGVTYTRTDLEDTSRKFAGVIAQEMREALPEVVSEDSNGQLSVAYGNSIGLLIECVKEQQTQIDQLKELVNQLINK